VCGFAARAYQGASGRAGAERTGAEGTGTRIERRRASWNPRNVDAEAVGHVVEPLIYPAIAAVLTVTARGIFELVRMLRRRIRPPEPDTGPPAPVVPEGVLLPEWVQRRLEAQQPAEPESVSPRAGGPAAPPKGAAGRAPPRLLSAQLDRLPTLPRRASVWKATVLGSFLVGFGIAGYFRTKADVLVGIVLTSPVFIAVAFVPTDTTASESGESTGPSWAYGVVYGTMAITGLYSYLRATS